MKKHLIYILLLTVGTTYGQIQKKDSIIRLKEVVVAEKFRKKQIQSDVKLSCSVDEYLATSDNVSFIKRGAYAWEPMLNNMNTERSNITIEGMHIFGACTDKMDPVTSYVETHNLSKIDIHSGQEGGMHGATIAGSIDLKRKRVAFSEEPSYGGSAQLGLQHNNMHRFGMADLYYSSEKFVADGTAAYRKAENYKAGDGNKVKHSQFEKYNTSLGLAYKTSELSALKADAIFDVAKNVGYPALPMDTWLARALISSLSFKQLFEDQLLKVWDTKGYFNAIEHYMDDTTRPENLVHMDMPGWSTTYGFTSKILLKEEDYTADIQLNGYSNYSLAEMTMYPKDRRKITGFALTWPGVTTNYGGLSLSNQWELTDREQLTLGGTFGIHHNHVEHLDFIRVFNQNTADSSEDKIRFLPSLYATYQVKWNPYTLSVGTGYGHRAPSVSEAYGYYIYNSFDRYDYIGTPNLKNEVSYELNGSLSYEKEGLIAEAKVNYFYIENYILGKILRIAFPMNAASVGVKKYEALEYAKIFNASLNLSYHFLENFNWKGSLNYARGFDFEGQNLPFIRPLSYQSSLRYNKNRLGATFSFNGDFTQTAYSPQYGEDRTPAYIVYNLSANYRFPLGKQTLSWEVGVENILDNYYSTYADWGNIPRMGRNIFTSVGITF